MLAAGWLLPEIKRSWEGSLQNRPVIIRNLFLVSKMMYASVKILSEAIAPATAVEKYLQIFPTLEIHTT